MDLKDYIKVQTQLLRQVYIELAGIDINDPETGTALRNQIWLAFTESGLAQEASQIYADLNLWGAGVRNGHNPLDQDPIGCARELLENYQASNPASQFPVLRELLNSLCRQEV